MSAKVNFHILLARLLIALARLVSSVVSVLEIPFDVFWLLGPCFIWKINPFDRFFGRVHMKLYDYNVANELKGWK